MVTRTVELCPHREDDPAACRLLERLLGPDGVGRCAVARDACEACVDAFPPTVEDINTVVASLLLSISGELLASGERLIDEPLVRSRHEWAETCLPIMFPDEDDAPALPGSALAGGTGWVDLAHLVPLPERRSGARVASWAVGVTTAPRRLPTLSYTLDALIAAGWDRPTLFIDESADVPDRFAGLDRVVRSPRAGAWPNYYLALAELTLREPEADAYLILQDDALVLNHPRLRDYVESCLWPGDRPGLVSLYGPGDYTRGEPGWRELPPPWFWGALAFAFPAEIARKFLADPEVLAHRRRGPEGGLAGIDVLIGRFAQRSAIPVSFPTPSLVQHIGHVSTLWPTARAGGSRRATRFAGDAGPGAVARKPAPVRLIRKARSVIGACEHRSGWPHAFAALQPLADGDADPGAGRVVLDDFIEQLFCYSRGILSHDSPWVGIFHHPPNMPAFMNREHVPSVMFATEGFRRSRPHLLGAIALSEYLAHYLGDVLGVPTVAVKHPSEVPALRWSPDRYAANRAKALIQIGWYLKNTLLLGQIPEMPEYRRLRLVATDDHIRHYDAQVAKHWRGLGSRRTHHPERIIEQARVTPARYDALLSENVVAIELFDASANNVIVECIARSTPIVVNRHPAVVEYLGADYPLYFADPEEIPGMLAPDRLAAAHEHLERMDRSWLDAGAFRESVRAALRSFGVG